MLKKPQANGLPGRDSVLDYDGVAIPHHFKLTSRQICDSFFWISPKIEHHVDVVHIYSVAHLAAGTFLNELHFQLIVQPGHSSIINKNRIH